MSEKPETYQVTAECSNCGHTSKKKTPNGTVIGFLEYSIPKGTFAGNYFATQVCLNCGCKNCLVRNR